MKQEAPYIYNDFERDNLGFSKICGNYELRFINAAARELLGFNALDNSYSRLPALLYKDFRTEDPSGLFRNEEMMKVCLISNVITVRQHSHVIVASEGPILRGPIHKGGWHQDQEDFRSNLEDYRYHTGTYCIHRSLREYSQSFIKSYSHPRYIGTVALLWRQRIHQGRKGDQV